MHDDVVRQQCPNLDRPIELTMEIIGDWAKAHDLTNTQDLEDACGDAVNEFVRRWLSDRE